jgi:hypothetical protein
METAAVRSDAVSSAGICDEGEEIVSSRLIRTGWLRRAVEVTLPDGTHVVDYDGMGIGYEQVSVDGAVIRECCPYWFVPRFESKLGGHPFVVEVRVWPWLLLRSLVLRVGDQVVYAEGVSAGHGKPAKAADDWAELA